MTETDAEISFRLFAGGIVDLCDPDKPNVIRQTTDMPTRLRRALARLSARWLLDGVPDRAASIHDALAMAARPAREWGIPSFAAGDFAWRDCVLVDADLGVPTRDCFEVASGPGSP